MLGSERGPGGHESRAPAPLSLRMGAPECVSARVVPLDFRLHSGKSVISTGANVIELFCNTGPWGINCLKTKVQRDDRRVDH